MSYLVFSQEQGELPDVSRLAAHATRFFGATLEKLGADDSSVRLKLSSVRPPFDAEMTLRVRAATREDHENARRAEVRGRAAGMAALAEKCKRVWELDAGQRQNPDDAAYLTLAAICASVALGPVLPSDHSTLFGVRGAIERRDRLESGK